MPLVEVTLVEGRTPEQLRELITKLTDAVETSVGVPRPSVHVCVREVPATNWADGDLTVAERRKGEPPAPSPTMD